MAKMALVIAAASAIAITIVAIATPAMAQKDPAKMKSILEQLKGGSSGQTPGSTSSGTGVPPPAPVLNPPAEVKEIRQVDVGKMPNPVQVNRLAEIITTLRNAREPQVVLMTPRPDGLSAPRSVQLDERAWKVHLVADKTVKWAIILGDHRQIVMTREQLEALGMIGGVIGMVDGNKSDFLEVKP